MLANPAVASERTFGQCHRHVVRVSKIRRTRRRTGPLRKVPTAAMSPRRSFAVRAGVEADRRTKKRNREMAGVVQLESEQYFAGTEQRDFIYAVVFRLQRNVWQVFCR